MDGKEIKVLVLSKYDVEKAVSFREVVDIVELPQNAWGNGEAVSGQLDFLEVPPEVAPGKHGNFMSYIAFFGNKSLNITGIAWVASCIHNPTEYGLPYAVGVQIINDTVTGVPLAIMEGSRLTEMVTAGASAVGAKYLARKDSKTIGIVGCGNQGRTHLQALKEIFDIENVKAFDIKRELLTGYVREMGEKTGITIQPAENPEEVVRASDIAVVAINPVMPVVKYEWIKQGALIIAMCGGGGELYRDEVYPKIDKIVVDNWENYKEQFEPPSLYADLAKGKYGSEMHKIVAGKQKGRENGEEKIVFMHSGVAVNDVAAGYLVYKKAKEKGLGMECRIL